MFADKLKTNRKSSTSYTELQRLLNWRVHVKSSPIDNPLASSSGEAKNTLLPLPIVSLAHWNLKPNQNSIWQLKSKLNYKERTILQIIIDELDTDSRALSVSRQIRMAMQNLQGWNYLPWFRYLKPIGSKFSTYPQKWFLRLSWKPSDGVKTIHRGNLKLMLNFQNIFIDDLRGTQ